MDLAFSGGRKLRLGEDPLVVDGDTAEQPFTTVIPVGRATEGEALNNAEQHSFIIRAVADEGSGSEEGSGSDEGVPISGNVVVQRALEPYFQQFGVMQTIAITDDITAFDITVRTGGIIRFVNETDSDIEVTCVKQHANQYC